MAVISLINQRQDPVEATAKTILPDSNADFRARIVVATDRLTWEVSPSGTVWRKPPIRLATPFL